jgi:hypothetical protein
MTEVISLNIGRCSNLLNSTEFFEPWRYEPTCLRTLFQLGLFTQD